MGFIVLIGSCLLALIPGFIAKNKNRSFWGYFFLSLLITPLITTIITLCLSFLNEPEPDPIPPEVAKLAEDWTCPVCGSKVNYDMNMCPNCGVQRMQKTTIEN